MADTKNMSAADIESALRGATFPASKQDLLNYAKNNRASKEVISMLNSLPNRQYKSVEDISEGGMGDNSEDTDDSTNNNM